MQNVLITGGAGFIGSCLARLLCSSCRVTVLDALTYAGDVANIAGVDVDFVRGDVRDASLVQALFDAHNFDAVFHLAAESHVDRSIDDGTAFMSTNVAGTAVMLEAARRAWDGDTKGKRFVHVSTDEVYGSLPLSCGDAFTEDTPLSPRSPYAASKAASDLVALSYYTTHGLPLCVTRCSNNYGPRQHSEKLIPTIVRSLASGRPAPLYGDGENVRDWIHAADHCDALIRVARFGVCGRVYNIGGGGEHSNRQMVARIAATLNEMGIKTPDPPFVLTADRKGHDRRYAIDSSRAKRELGWTAKTPFDEGLRQTAMWYASRL